MHSFICYFIRKLKYFISLIFFFFFSYYSSFFNKNKFVFKYKCIYFLFHSKTRILKYLLFLLYITIFWQIVINI